MDINIVLQKLEDNNYSQSSSLNIKDGKMCLSIHDFGENTPNGDEIEIWHNFDEENTRRFLESFDLLGKNDVIIQNTLEEHFGGRNSTWEFDQYIKKLHLTYKFSSWD